MPCIVDPPIPLDVLSCFDPLGNATHTALQYDLVGEDVLITGAGPIGCMATAIAWQAGARKVVVTDVNPDRLALAARMGATRTVDVSKEKLPDVQREIGMKEGFDVGFEMSGNPVALKHHDRQHGPRRPHRPARHHARRRCRGLEQSRFQHAHDPRHLRPRDV
jgi:threonine dehydrogenase-like Zn-dependent dehydrogenase